MSRYVQIPPDVEFVSKVTGKPDMEIDPETKKLQQKRISFRQFVFGLLIHHPLFSSVVGGRALYKFEQALDAASAGDGIMQLDEDVWEIFRKALDKPAYQVGVQTFEGFAGYNGAGVMQMIPLIDAILDAPHKKPSALRPVPEASTPA